ncbi:MULTISPECIES: maleylacetoacetate isomerase [unclassified Caballeronia]|uniref:maleylacetoacetate isomerase n=1 Tax=unclassified Caballeronia TaxID=2646786 RepID=UPI001F360BFF|nr:MULTISPECIES: maleylacetoacetate isomerase [unclassified Caballeronia]MCE4546026.1 maleylacetoacetate isomerase [Caballeronia sp. PC1]MCE4573501.1 maleylacetoacetate isomerase [Caballeronia sp. CLC5]
MANDLTLYDYFRSSASFRVRIALNLKGLTYAQVPVHLLRDGGEQFSAAYRAINPAQAVPTLMIGSGSEAIPIAQSLAIIEYLEEVYPQPSLLPTSPEDRAYVRSVAYQIACDIHPINNLRVLKYLQATFGANEDQKKIWIGNWITTGFSALEEMFSTNSRTGKFVFGDEPSLADICLVPQVWNARRYGVPLDAYPTLLRIADDAGARKAFADADPSVEPRRRMQG